MPGAPTEGRSRDFLKVYRLDRIPEKSICYGSGLRYGIVQRRGPTNYRGEQSFFFAVEDWLPSAIGSYSSTGRWTTPHGGRKRTGISTFPVG